VEQFEIVTSFSKRWSDAACPTGKKVIGCHLYPTIQSNGYYEVWRDFLPLTDGSGETIFLVRVGVVVFLTVVSNRIVRQM
jgi:hypothetical protein